MDIGHNNPPAFDEAALAEISAEADAFLDATQQWLTGGEIETEENAQLLNDQINGLRGLYKRMDAQRKDQKKPHDDAGKAVQAAYSPVLQKLKLAGDTLKGRLSTYLDKKARAEEEARRKAAVEAERLRLEAKARKAKAESEGDISAMVDAQSATEQADVLERQSQSTTTTKVASASGGGRAMSLRTYQDVEVTNALKLFLHYKDDPEIVETLRTRASRDVRAKNVDSSVIPGIKVTERRVAA